MDIEKEKEANKKGTTFLSFKQLFEVRRVNFFLKGFFLKGSLGCGV